MSSLASATNQACPACARLERVRAGTDPFFLAELRESYVLLHKHQRYPGWCSLFVKRHREHLHEFERNVQARLWEDVMDVSGAIVRAFGPARLNYENLGNVVGHVHWHVIPRYDSSIDPDPGATVWVRPESERDCGVSDADRDSYIARLRAAGLNG